MLAAKAFSCLRQIPHVKLLQEAVQHVRLSNGSQIVAVPGGEGAGVRGFTPNLLIVDESAFIASESGLWEAIMPSLAVSGGSLLLCSTPNGRQGLHYEIASNPEPDGWLKFLVPWTSVIANQPRFHRGAARTFARAAESRMDERLQPIFRTLRWAANSSQERYTTVYGNLLVQRQRLHRSRRCLPVRPAGGGNHAPQS